MSLELSYNLRYLTEKKTSSLMTIAGIALVVMVFVATLMLSNGIRETLRGTGSPRNVIVIRNGAQNEIQSGVKRDDSNALLADEAILRHPDNTPVVTTDAVVVASLRKRSDGGASNVTVRGVSKDALALREGISVVSGRLPSFGTREVMVGSPIFAKFAGTGIGESLRIGGLDWNVVGIFSAGNSGFSSEVWGDSEVLMPVFRREQFSSLTFRLTDPNEFDAFKSRVENTPRVSVVVRRESEFYESQSKILATFISAIGITISIFFSIGAILGAVITMHSAVASRKHEIGVLRALGFKPIHIFRAFAAECIFISLIGGIIGTLLAALTSFATISTTNFDTFSDIRFGFSPTPGILLSGILFAGAMGILGSFFPALSAARLKVIDALRSTS
jgi:putative ABC transport system permease protein